MSDTKDPNNSEEKKDNDEYEKYCYMCRRPESEAGQLISFMKGLYICPDCMNKAFNSFSNSPIRFFDASNFPGFDNLNQFMPTDDIPDSQKVKKRHPKPEKKDGKADEEQAAVAERIGQRGQKRAPDDEHILPVQHRGPEGHAIAVVQAQHVGVARSAEQHLAGDLRVQGRTGVERAAAVVEYAHVDMAVVVGVQRVAAEQVFGETVDIYK